MITVGFAGQLELIGQKLRCGPPQERSNRASKVTQVGTKNPAAGTDGVPTDLLDHRRICDSEVP